MSEPSDESPDGAPAGPSTDESALEPGADASEPSHDDAEVVGVDSDAADDLISALGSETARTVLTTIHDDPASPSELADRLDMSIQRVHYHVQNLLDADLVEAVDTTRADGGNEMTVYGPTERPVVVFAGTDERSDLRSMLSGLLSAFGILTVASLLVQQVLGDGVDALLGGGGGAGDGGSGMSTASAEAVSQGATGPPPGVVFFLGGAVVLLAAAAVWYWRRVR